MHKKATVLFLVALAASLFYTVTTPTRVACSPSQPSIYIDPPAIIDETVLVNDTFTISVKIADIPVSPGLVGVQFKVTWDSSVLTGVSMEEILFNTVTPPGDLTNIWKLQHTIGASAARYGYTWQNLTRAFEGGYAPMSGNHTVANITLKVISLGVSDLDLQETKLGDPDGQPIVHQTFDGYFQNAPPPPPALLYVDPSKILNLTLTPCHNFTVDIDITNATDLYEVEFKLAYDPTIVHATEVVAGDFIPLAVTPTVMINNTAGYLWFQATLGTPLSGNGTLAVVMFHVEGLGKTSLDLYDSALSNQTGQPLSHDSSDGSFNNILLPKLAVDPEEIINPSIVQGSKFKINITIAYVEDLYGYQFNLTYNSDVLMALQVQIHDVLGEINYIPNQIINNFEGFVWVNVTYYSPANPLTVTPPTPLATVEFRVKTMGCSNLTLHETDLVDSVGQPILHETSNGYFCAQIRDIAVINVNATPNAVYPGFEFNISVTVKNEGDISETFDITVYYDNSSIGTIPITNLDPGENITGYIIWDTTSMSPGAYTLKAEVPILPFEVDTADNVLVDGIVKIKIPGDINGDDVVDIFDALLIADAFGSYPGHPRWNPLADLNGDGVVDIFDVIIISSNFGASI